MSNFSGIWYKNKPKFSYKLRTFMSWFLSIGVCSCMMIEAINDINDFKKLPQALYMMITWIAYMIKLAGFMYNGQIMLQVIDYIDNPIFLSFPKHLDDYLLKPIQFTTRLCNFLRMMYMTCIPMYLLYPIFDNVPLPFPFPYDLGHYTYLMFAFQFIGEFFAAWNNACLDTTCIGLIGIAIAQLNVLGAKLNELNQQEDSHCDQYSQTSACEYLKQCVKHHVAIMKLVTLTERIFTVGLLAQLFATIVVCCNTVLQFLWVTISGEFIVLIIYFFALQMQIFIYCWYGNELIVKSLQIRDACYTSKWYKCDKEAGQYLFIMMERSKKPLQISAMKYSVLSLASFMAIWQWSYSVLTLLVNLYEKKLE